ncbi:MAG: c-type cytochrome [Gemmatimonadota bacterium]
MTSRIQRSALALISAFVACGGNTPEATVTMSEGEALYQTHCAMCHGDGLEGDGPMAAGLPVQPPSLFEHLAHHTEAQLFGLIRDGVPPAMPPAPLTDEEIRLVVDFAWTQVPDSLVDELREMQRMMEQGRDAESMDHDDMDHGAMGHDMPSDTTGR